MRRLTIVLLVAWSLGLAQKPAANQKGASADPVQVVRSFLPPRTQLATLYTFDYLTMRYGRDFPAVLEAHVLSSTSEDIIFAYYSPQGDVFDKTLFVTLLHGTSSGYQKVYELSYRAQVLLVSKAIRIVHLQNVPVDAIAVIAGIGASLGGQLQVFVWRDPWGWKNIFPPNGGMHYFYFFPSKTGVDVALSASKRPGLDVSPPVVWFRWNGESFVKVAPPEGSSKWPLPD